MSQHNQSESRESAGIKPGPMRTEQRFIPNHSWLLNNCPHTLTKQPGLVSSFMAEDSGVMGHEIIQEDKGRVHF